MTRVRGRRLWCRIEAHGGTIPVYIITGELKNDDGSDVDAYYDHEVPCIVVKHTGNIAAMQQRLHHEILHVCFAAHSGDGCSFLGSNVNVQWKREESIVSFLEPVQFDLLVRNGFLKYPKPPKAPK